MFVVLPARSKHFSKVKTRAKPQIQTYIDLKYAKENIAVVHSDPYEALSSCKKFWVEEGKSKKRAPPPGEAQKKKKKEGPKGNRTPDLLHPKEESYH